MTDKQIIIDGVDVSGCEYYREDVFTNKQLNNVCSIGLWQRHYKGLEPSCVMSCQCKQNQNCSYKQLKRKEQEFQTYRKFDPIISRILKQCETFKQVKSLSPIDFINNLIKENDELKDEINSLRQAGKKDCAYCIDYRSLEIELNKLKAENNELKGKLSFMDCVDARKEEEKQKCIMSVTNCKRIKKEF